MARTGTLSSTPKAFCLIRSRLTCLKMTSTGLTGRRHLSRERINLMAQAGKHLSLTCIALWISELYILLFKLTVSISPNALKHSWLKATNKPLIQDYYLLENKRWDFFFFFCQSIFDDVISMDGKLHPIRLVVEAGVKDLRVPYFWASLSHWLKQSKAWPW